MRQCPKRPYPREPNGYGTHQQGFTLRHIDSCLSANRTVDLSQKRRHLHKIDTVQSDSGKADNITDDPQ